MFGMMISSAKLFLAGKLFKDNRLVARQFAMGVAAGTIAGVAAGVGAPIWVAAIVAGGVAGFVQPILLRDVKYA